ncbi:MAG: MATE family efflux transporter [Pseudomonadales bacterium]|jgi:putative MATE family efflux protein|nr:MATE family efflux transporter [Pseudomonadales bacterium]
MAAPGKLTQGPIGKSLLLFALPILGGNVAQSLNGSVNAMWIGHYLGEAALTAAANANNVMFFLIGAVFGIGMASTILVGQAMGAGDVAQARKVVGSSATFFMGAAVLISLWGYTLAPHLLVTIHTPAESLPLAEAYLRVIFLAMPFLYAFAFLSAALRGTGDSKTPFRFLLLAVALDIVLNPMLLFGIGPFPKLGIAGAAWSTWFSQGIALSGLLFYLRRKRHVLWLGRQGLKLLIPDPQIIRTLVFKGLPMGFQMVLISLAMIAVMSVVNGFGTDTVAAYGAAAQTWTYVQMPAMAIGAACSSMAAQNVGARLWDRVAGTTRSGVMFNFVLTGALVLPLILFDRWTLALFLPPESAEVLALARHLNHIAVWSFLFFGVTFVVSGVVRATGAVLPPLIILGLALWGIRVPFASLLLDQLGADAVWWSFPASSVCSMLMSLAYYRWGNWRKAHMLTTPSAAPATASPAEKTSPTEESAG